MNGLGINSNVAHQGVSFKGEEAPAKEEQLLTKKQLPEATRKFVADTDSFLANGEKLSNKKTHLEKSFEALPVDDKASIKETFEQFTNAVKKTTETSGTKIKEFLGIVENADGGKKGLGKVGVILIAAITLIVGYLVGNSRGQKITEDAAQPLR